MSRITKRLIAIAASAFLLLGLVSVPAQAANKAGGSCKKTNQKAKIGGFDYICQKNPTVKRAKLTWLIKECIDSNNQYIAGKKSYAKKLQEKADLLAQFAAAEADTSLTQAATLCGFTIETTSFWFNGDASMCAPKIQCNVFLCTGTN